MTDLREQIEAAWSSEETQSTEPQNNVATSEDNQTATAEPVEVITAPHSYKQEFKDTFNTLTPEWQKYLSEREKEVEQGLSRARNQYSWVDKIYTDRKDALSQMGYANAQDYLGDLVLMHEALVKNPSATIDALKTNYGIIDGGSQQDNALLKKVQTLADTVERQQVILNNQQNERVQNELQAFLGAKDDAGNPKHPYLEDVKDEMTVLLGKGLANNYEDAYNQAIWRVEGVRNKIIASKTNENMAQKASVAQKAKTAAFDPSSKKEGTQKALSLREEIERNYDNLIGD